jgi:hypothetical protein
MLFFQVPLALGSGLHSIHKCSHNHVPCNVECILKWTSTSTGIKQMGGHSHLPPHKRKASKNAVQCLHYIIKVNSEAKPPQIMLGTPTRESAHIFHPLWGNLDRLAYFMSKFNSSTKSTSLEELLLMEDELCINFLHICDLMAGVIVIQFPVMKTIVQMK